MAGVEGGGERGEGKGGRELGEHRASQACPGVGWAWPQLRLLEPLREGDGNQLLRKQCLPVG